MRTNDMNDWSLLREYVERRSEAAFETLVGRHLDMVYSAAWRQAGDPDLAQEAAQAAFVLLARKASRLSARVVVAGWLYRTACLTAKRALRDQTRRRIKDHEAAEMRLTDSNNEVWTRLKPHLDTALANLGEAERTAIVLRFLEQRSFRDVAATLSISEDAAKKRVSRALEKLRLVFTRQGVVLSLSAIAAALSERAAEAAPPGLLRSSVQAGLSGGMSAGPEVGALATGVVRDALMSWIKWGGTLAGVGLILAVIGTFHWLTPKSSGPTDANAAIIGDTIAAVPSKPVRARLEQPSAPADAVNDRAMVLRVLAEESDQPLAGVDIHVDFVVIPDSIHATFVTDAEGIARMPRPTNDLAGVNCWVFAPGRVPTSLLWKRMSVASPGPDYTLRLPQGRWVAGIVVDDSGQAVAGAKVHFQTQGMGWDSREYADYEGPMSLPQAVRRSPPVTDAHGRWSADFISPRAKSLFGYVEHPEFATTQFGHIQPPDPVEPSTNMVLVLEPGASLAGALRDATGLTISDGSVYLRNPFGLPDRWAKTDPGGHFTFSQVARGEVFLTADAPGFQSSGELPVQSGQATNLDIVLKPVAAAGPGNARIRAQVRSETGQPINGALVHLAPEQLGLEENQWGTFTDAEGRFVWNFAPDHPVKMIVGGLPLDWEEQQVELTPDGTEAVITLKLKTKVRLHGTVSDQSDRNPLPEFKVLWAPGMEKGYVVNTEVLTEGRDGKFAIELLPEQVRNYNPPGTNTRLDFRAPGYVNKLVLLLTGTNDINLNIELEPATDIVGTILRPNGAPAAGAKVFFRGEHFRFRVSKDCFVSRGEYPFAVDTSTGVDGAFRIPKIDGIERLEVVHPEGWATVPLDGSSTALIQLQPWGRINGVVQSSQGVVPGAEIEILEARTVPEQLLFGMAVKSDAEGRFDFPQVPGGRALVSVRPPQTGFGSNSPALDIEVKPGQATNLTFSAQAQ